MPFVIINPYGPTDPYANIPNRVPSNFWGSPVIQLDDGTLSCPGFTGPTYSKRIDDFVRITVPFGATGFPAQAQTPGLCEVTAFKARKYDLKSPKGADGGRFTTMGIEPSTVEVRVTIWTPQQLEELRKLWEVVFPGVTKTSSHTVLGARSDTTVTRTSNVADPGADTVNRQASFQTVPQVGSTKTHKVIDGAKNESQPFDASHPTLDFHKIKHVTWVKGEGPMKGGFAGSRIFVMTGVEFMPPGKVDATKTAKGSVAASGSTLDRPTPSQVSGNTDP